MKLFIIFFVFLLSINKSNAQGCVAIRSNGQVCTADMMSHAEQKDEKWQLNINNRYFKSYKHFKGAHEEKIRVENNTEVINHSWSTDITLTRMLNKRWALSANLPVIANTRSSLYEHGGRSRHSTESFGIGDVRASASYWVVNPEKRPKGNLQAGLGIKLPTGDYKREDFFFVNDSTTRLGPVDQSIQLGDGGTGFTLELNGYYNLAKNWSVYGNFFYLLNPREHNGVSTARGGTTAATAILYGTSVMSVPDQYMLRAGVNFGYKDLNVSAGMRQDCVTVNDLVGGSSGFRRPGFVWSVEPTITYRIKKVFLYAAVPVAVDRNRTQSVPDKVRTQLTGVNAHGDAAFSDYTINLGMFFKF